MKKTKAKTNKKTKFLVAYYSRGGNTRKLADHIARNLDADKEEIIDLKSRKGIFGWLGAGRDATLGRETKIRATVRNPEKYDVVVIGTPTWSGNITPAMRTYVRCNKNRFGRVACFATMGGKKPGSRVHTELKRELGQKPIAVLNVRAHLIRNNLHRDILGDFIQKVKENSRRW